MSHLDELDEYEADLEPQLRREYSAVFGLFRYCVLTQDATYLCNKLDLQYIPQPAYPFFQLKMEDVWVWDKNRPTRIIPRAEVYTSGDVTVEELRADGEDPGLTAAALAERIRVLLAVDVGNTQTALGLFGADGLGDHWRLATERTRTGDELGVLLTGLLDLDAVDGICLSTTVPPLVREWEGGRSA